MENILIPIVPPKGKTNSNIEKPFDRLSCHIPDDEILKKMHQLSRPVDYIQTYIDPTYQITDQKKCIAIRTSGVTDITTTTIEMNAVAARNTRCDDPKFCFILSWPEDEHPNLDAIFDAAEHAIKAVGLAEHQYFLVVYCNTPNFLCHVTINRIHPTTFLSHNINWSFKTLHFAARESEIKHGWIHDNGLYIVKKDANNQKRIVAIKRTCKSKVKSLP